MGMQLQLSIASYSTKIMPSMQGAVSSYSAHKVWGVVGKPLLQVNDFRNSIGDMHHPMFQFTDTIIDPMFVFY